VFDISDAVVILTCLFLDVACRECQDASDANDDGAVDMSDATYLVNWRFGSRVAPPPPFPACGADPTADDLESTCGDPGCD
jgi:hypothetical protein